MRYSDILPYQLREAIAKNTPVLLAIGVLEYHSEHLPLGVDTKIIEGVFDRLEEEHPEVVILPAFYYGTASYAVAPPEGKGSVSIDSQKVSQLAEELFASLLQVGLKNIHGFVYHQSENFAQGMPTDLAFRFGARRAIFAHLERERGQGWWGQDEMRNYYEGDNPFDWIQIHPLTEGMKKTFGGDHAGKIETSAMMELFPELVHMDKLTSENWYAESAAQASHELGRDYIGTITDAVTTIVFPDSEDPSSTL